MITSTHGHETNVNSNEEYELYENSLCQLFHGFVHDRHMCRIKRK